MKFEGYSIVKSPTGISIRPNDGKSDTEVCLRVEDGSLVVTVYDQANSWSAPDDRTLEFKSNVQTWRT